MSSDVFRCSPWVAYEPPPDDGADGGDGDGPPSPQDPPPEPGRAFTKFRVKLRAQDAVAGDGAAQAPGIAAAPGAGGGEALDGQPAAGAVPPEQSTSAEQLAMMNTFELGPNKDWKAATIKPPRKKPSKRGAAAGGASTGRGGIRKAATIKNAQRAVAEGEDLPDDASFASSPIQGPREISIEPEASNQVASPSRQHYTPQPQPVILDDPGPAPVYPAPGRALAVAQPIKPTTAAPKDVQIDRTTAPVRRWRIARREIRGIAGGRWFAQTWVGGKDSEWASANAAAQLLSMAAGPSAYAATTSKPGKHTTKLAGSSLPTPVLLPDASSSPVRGGDRARDEVESEDVTMIEL